MIFSHGHMAGFGVVAADQAAAKDQAVASLRSTLADAQASWAGGDFSTLGWLLGTAGPLAGDALESVVGDNTRGQVLANLAADVPRIDALDTVVWNRVVSGEKDFTWWVSQAATIDSDIRFNAKLQGDWGLLPYLANVAGATVQDIKDAAPGAITLFSGWTLLAIAAGSFITWKVLNLQAALAPRWKRVKKSAALDGHSQKKRRTR